MKDNGYLRIATDAEDYANHVQKVVQEVNGELQDLTTASAGAALSAAWKRTLLYDHNPCEQVPAYRPVTKYEIKASEEGRRVWEMEFVVTRPINSERIMESMHKRKTKI